MRRAAIFLLILLLPVTASAQETAVYQGLVVKELPTAYVLDDTGVETKGKLLNLDTGSVVLLVDGNQRRFDLANVRRVSRRGDSLKNGAIGGAVCGALMGVLSMALADCPGRGSSCPGARFAGVVLSTAFYTAVGAGLDAAIQGRTVLYRAAPPPMSAHNRRAVVGMRVTW